MIDRLTQLFPLWAVLFSLFAFLVPEPLARLDHWIVPLLMIIMFGMGMSLTGGDFIGAGRQPLLITVGVALQFLIMPLAALLAAWLLAPTPEVLIGLVIVGACPGGTASNVICYLARADVALSISITMASTLVAVLATPFLVWFYLGETIPVPVSGMLASLVQIVLFPVAAGTLLNSFFHERLTPVRRIFPLISVLAIVLVIGIIVAANRDHVLAGGLLVMLAVILHNTMGLGLGYAAARLLRLDQRRARTLAIEVGMQNSGLGVALATQHFSAAAALPGALFSIWHNLSGSFLAWWWTADRREWPL